MPATKKRKPAYQPILTLPPLPREEFLALRDNIAVNGVLVPILVDESRRIIDGRHRKRIAEELGYDCPEVVQAGLTEEEKRTLARALNLARRHFSTAEKRQLIADQLAETPQRSNRWIGRQLGVHHATVAGVRVELQATGQIIQFERTVGQDGKYRPGRPRHKPFASRQPDDFYPTPPHATAALLGRERFTGPVLEPACGDGAMVRVLRKHGCTVEAADLLYGQDFLLRSGRTANVITNPPFRLAQEFVAHAKAIATRKVAMLLPVEFLHGVTRYELFQDRGFPLKIVYVFAARLCFGMDRPAAVAHAWYVWDRSYRGEPRIGWIR